MNLIVVSYKNLIVVSYKESKCRNTISKFQMCDRGYMEEPNLGATVVLQPAAGHSLSFIISIVIMTLG